MSAVISFIEDVLTAVWDAFTDVVKAVWDAVVEPILEEVFSWFGIEDETIINVQRISSRVYSQNTIDVYEAGVARAVLNMVRNETDFFPNFMAQVFRVKGQLKSYFRYGELDLFWNGLPEMVLKGTFVNFDDVQLALDAELGSTHTVLSAIDRNPTEFQYYYWDMKTTHNYKAWLNTLTFTDTLYGATREGWFVDDIIFNSGPNNYTISLSRTMETAEFFIYGPSQITEGETATYTIRSNRVVPSGEQITIGFSYAGTAVNGVDFTEVASVIMPQNVDEITVDLVTLETGNANRTMAITIATLDNGTGVFEHVNINALDTVTTTITDDDALLLTMSDQLTEEANTTITIDVVLNQVAPSGAFTVDYTFTDLGGITGGVDYDNTPGTLNFAGTNGEIQQITVDIFADVANDDLEQFRVSLLNSSDIDGINIGATSTVTILDKTSDPTPGTTLILDSFIKTPAFVKEPSIIVTYSDDSEPPGQFHYWVHPHSDITYDLAATHQSISDLQMMPLAIIRKEKTQWDVLHAPLSPEFFTTRMLMSRVGLDINQFLDATGANPDIAQIDDSYLNFSVSPFDTNPIVSKMLWLQWEQILITSGLQSNVDLLSATLKEGDIENAIVWSGHTVNLGVAGTIAATGSYIHSTTVANTLTLQYQKVDNFYDEMILTNVNGMTSINYQTYHEVALNTVVDENFTIPISWKIFDEVPAREQMEVFQYLCRMDMNAVVITHLEWYETSAFLDLFEFVLVIILIIVTVISFGTAFSAATSIYAGFLAIVEQLVVNWAIGELFIFVAKHSGNNFLTALIITIAAVYSKNPDMFKELALMSGEQLLDTALDFAQEVGTLFIDLENYQNAEEIEQKQLALQEQEDQLEELREHRPDVSALENNFVFASQMDSVSTGNFNAIQQTYNYDTLYNYDNIVGNYHEQQLLTGVS